MKKTITSLLAACMCLSVMGDTGSLFIRAEELSTHENPIIETREVDWPDYNYGNWQDVAKHPEKHQKVVQCIGKVIQELDIDITTSAVLAALGQGATLGTALGVRAATHFTKCMLS